MRTPIEVLHQIAVERMLANDREDPKEFNMWLRRADAAKDLIDCGEVQPDVEEVLTKADRIFLEMDKPLSG